MTHSTRKCSHPLCCNMVVASLVTLPAQCNCFFASNLHLGERAKYECVLNCVNSERQEESSVFLAMLKITPFFSNLSSDNCYITSEQSTNGFTF